MFESVADLAARRLAIGTVELGRGSLVSNSEKPVSGENADTHSASVSLETRRGEGGKADGHDDTRYRMERERERERERVMEAMHRKSNRVKAWEQHIARTGSPDKKMDLNAQPPPYGTNKDPAERTYGDIRNCAATVGAGLESAKECATSNDEDDESLSLAIYFDEEMRLLCQLPFAVRALRRDLASDIANFLG